MLAGVLIVLIVIAVGLGIAQDQETLRIRTAVAISDPRFPQYLADLLGHRLTASNSYVVYTNGDHALPAMLHAIEEARERVSLETYNFEEGEIAARFTDALARAAQRGVSVRMVLDAIGSKNASAKDIDRLEDAGCHLGWVNPVVSYSIADANYRTHRKALVVDGVFSVIGSANFDNRSLELNNELSVAVFDRALTERLEADFEHDLTRTKKIDLERWRARPVLDRGRDWLWSYFGEVF